MTGDFHLVSFVIADLVEIINAGVTMLTGAPTIVENSTLGVKLESHRMTSA